MAKKQPQILMFKDTQEMIKHFNENYPVWRFSHEEQHILALVKGEYRDKTLTFECVDNKDKIVLKEIID